MSLFLLAISIMAATLAFVALRWGKAERANLPGNLGDTWPQLDEWEADTEEAITQALRNIAADATPIYSATAAQHPWVIETLHHEEFAQLRADLADEGAIERWIS